MEIIKDGSVAKVKLTKDIFPFLYFEIYSSYHYIYIFYNNTSYLKNAPWSDVQFDIKEYPINENTVNRILIEYRRFILSKLMEAYSEI